MITMILLAVRAMSIRASTKLTIGVTQSRHGPFPEAILMRPSSVMIKALMVVDLGARYLFGQLLVHKRRWLLDKMQYENRFTFQCP
jgi:hypothetical protein